MSRCKWLLAGVVLASMMFMGGCSSSGDGDTVVKNRATAASHSEILPGDVCANGGILVNTGIDTNGNGILDEDEILASEPVCNGLNGTDGTNGLSTLLLLSDAPTSECANGGVHFDSGIDDNSDGVLDPAEIDQSKFVCNPPKMLENCDLCHNPGKSSDVQSVHPGNEMTVPVTATVDSFTVNGGFATINFTVKDANGDPLPGLKVAQAASPTRLQYFRIGYVQLKAGATATDPNTWVPLTTGDRLYANLTDNGNGTYTYVSTTDISTLYDPALVTRVMLIVQTGDLVSVAYNATVDFPGTGPVLTRNVVTTAACNSCHGVLGSPLGTASFHSGQRKTSEACTVCHITTLGSGEAYYTTMVHKIHSAKNFALGDYSGLTYPQDLRNCTTCHKGSDEYWKTIQNAQTCFNNCHDTTVVSAYSHVNIVTNNTACVQCHNGAGTLDIAVIHRTENATPNNPVAQAGLANFAYFVDSVTVDASNNAVITFHIQKDGVDLDLLGSGTVATVPSGFTGSPSFLFAYALPQDGISAPADYNNLGRAAAQPATQAIVGLTLTGTPAAYVATIANAFPANAKLRNVGLQGYFSQTVGTTSVGRHTRSVVKAVAGEERREVVSSAACAACHEIFEGHGGNRNLTADGGVEICVTCHNPNLSSSGRAADPAGLPQATIDALGNNPLIFPEATNNLKDMIHGIHSAENPVRTLTYEFVRNRSGGLYYNWSEVTFPGILSNCQTCHIAGTYDADLPSGVLMTTNVTSNGTNPMTRAAVTASRNTVPNATDEVISPVTASCFSCHADSTRKSHMQQQGGGFDLRKNVAQ